MANIKHWDPAQLTPEAVFAVSARLEEWGWAHDIIIDAFSQDENHHVRARRVQIRKPRITARWIVRLQELADEHGAALVFNHGRLEIR